MGTIMRNNVVYGSSASNIIELSMADYEAREAAGGIDSDVLYFIPDAEEYANVSANTNISDFFSIETDYVAGDFCIFNNQLYEFVEDKPAGSWDEEVVRSTNIKEIIDEKLSTINYNLDSNALTYNPETDYFGVNINGEWHDVLKAGFERTYLYQLGNEYTDVTGGWRNIAMNDGYTKSSLVTFDKGETYMKALLKVKIDGEYRYHSNVVFETTNAIDLSSYSKLYIEVNHVSNVISGTSRLQLTSKASTTTDFGTPAYEEYFTDLNGTGIVCLDLSNVFGSYYIAIRGNNSASNSSASGKTKTITVLNVWLET